MSSHKYVFNSFVKIMSVTSQYIHTHTTDQLVLDMLLIRPNGKINYRSAKMQS